MKGLLAILRGDVSSIGDLTYALRLDQDVSLSVMTLAVGSFEAIQSNDAIKRIAAKLQFDPHVIPKIAATGNAFKR